MEKTNQTQKAGDNSPQIQAGTINITNLTQGLTKEDAQKMCFATSQEVAQMFSLQAKEECYRRIETYTQILLDRLETVEGALEELKRPEILRDIMESQRSACCTDIIDDYELLAELMVERTTSVEDRKKALVVRKAIDVVDQIDEGALCALTVFFSFLCLASDDDGIDAKLADFSEVFEDLLYLPLPYDDRSWIDHLSLLNILNISSADSQFVSFEQMCKRKYEDLFEDGEESPPIDVFIEKWDSYDSLKEVHKWWNSFSVSFELTPVGAVIGLCNSQKMTQKVPKTDVFKTLFLK